MGPEWICESNRGCPGAWEERSLHRRIEPRHKRLHAGVEKAQRLISVIPVPARQMAEGPPVMWLQLRGNGSRGVSEGFRAAVPAVHPRPRPVEADQSQAMTPGP